MRKIKLFVFLGVIIVMTNCGEHNNNADITTDSTKSTGLSAQKNTEIDTIINPFNFVSSNYYILSKKKGDLNLDSIDDMILVLGQNGEDTLSNTEHPLKRKLLILYGLDKGGYKLAFENENAIYYYMYDLNFRDAFVDIRISNGNFTIDHYGGFARRWGRSTTFKYITSKKNWFLYEDEYTTFNATGPEDRIEKQLNSPKNYGKVSFAQFNIYK